MLLFFVWLTKKPRVVVTLDLSSGWPSMGFFLYFSFLNRWYFWRDDNNDGALSVGKLGMFAYQVTVVSERESQGNTTQSFLWPSVDVFVII